MDWKLSAPSNGYAIVLQMFFLRQLHMNFWGFAGGGMTHLQEFTG